MMDNKKEAKLIAVRERILNTNLHIDEVDELAQAITSIARNRELREHMAISGRKKIIGEYDLESITSLSTSFVKISRTARSVIFRSL